MASQLKRFKLRRSNLYLLLILVGISYSYLRKIFSTLFGTTFLEYLHSIRIEKAKILLNDTNEGISDIAAKVGYTNTARFNRNFRKTMGCTPSEYRLRVRKSLT